MQNDSVADGTTVGRIVQALNDLPGHARVAPVVTPAAELCIPRGAQGRTALLLVGAGSLLSAIGDDKLAASGLDSREYSILSILDTDGPGSQQELARLLGKAPAIVVAAVDDLEDRGLVTRTRDPADRRRSRVTVTTAGSKALSHADELAAAAVAELFAGLDAGDLRQLQDLLGRGLQPMIDGSTPRSPVRAPDRPRSDGLSE
jgi:MarR family transcriptional regulator, lower aerobic nicotinate degradation pathway regulator